MELNATATRTMADSKRAYDPLTAIEPPVHPQFMPERVVGSAFSGWNVKQLFAGYKSARSRPCRLMDRTEETASDYRHVIQLVNRDVFDPPVLDSFMKPHALVLSKFYVCFGECARCSIV